MKKRFEKAVAEYVKAFCKKHGLEFEFWVADLIGTVGSFSDYYFTMEDIRLDIDTKQPKGKIFDWYEHHLVKKNNHVNYYTYCLSNNKLKIANP